jgi:predicted adenylyl cyclase CyaB
MKNIEIKAKFPNRERGIALAKSLGASDEGTLHQIDTYFNVDRGRLKLREINNSEFQLIFYERPDEDGPKTSSYQIVPVPDPQLLKAVLDQAIGIWKVVEKYRVLFLLDEVRIHLDHVSGLGDFLEFEGVIQNEASKDATRAKVDQLVIQFGLSPNDLLSGSYSDMV